MYLVVALVTIGPLGAVGLALANAVQNSSHALILLFLLQRACPGCASARRCCRSWRAPSPPPPSSAAWCWSPGPWLSMPGGLIGLVRRRRARRAVYGVLLHLLGVPESRAPRVALVRARLGR